MSDELSALRDLEQVVRRGLLAEGDNDHGCADPTCLLCDVRRKVAAIDAVRAANLPTAKPGT
jgi:hypothetical protein